MTLLELSMIEFIDYIGNPALLCEGRLILCIDGQELSFGDKDGCDYPRFWMSRGDCGGDKGNTQWEPHRAGWAIKKSKLPGFLAKQEKELERLMTENIRPWCSGGCRYK